MIASLAVLAGCAKLSYRKVPTPTQYTKWTDEMQKKADAMEGVRYYLPRPFINVKHTFPVSQRSALVSFSYVAKADGEPAHYQLEKSASAPEWVKRSLPDKISVMTALTAQLTTPDNINKNEQQTDEGDGAGETSEETTAEGTVNIPSKLVARTGFLNQTDPVTELGPYMDIVYAPDFEEQYVIQASPGLGTADVETQLRNGWAAEVFSMQVDNSNLIPYVIEQIKNASDTAASIAGTWGVNIATAGASGAAQEALEAIGGQETEDAAATAVSVMGQMIMFKVVEVRFAQPGFYPILKPREVLYWMRGYEGGTGNTPRSYNAPSATDSKVASETIDLYFKKNGEDILFKTVTTDQAADSDLAMRAYFQKMGMPWVHPDVFIPAPPFTMVGFNTTTDIFLAPAGEPTSISLQEPPANGGGNNGTILTPEKAIEKLITDAKEASLKGTTVLKVDSINANTGVSPAVDASTSIEIGFKTAVAPADQAGIVTKLTTLIHDQLLKGIQNAQTKHPVTSNWKSTGDILTLTIKDFSATQMTTAVAKIE